MYSSAIVVGGSLSGLMAGLHLKRQGVNVTILEQDASSERSSHNAGIQLGAHARELLRQDDDTGLRLALETSGSRWSVGLRRDVLHPVSKGPGRLWTNWGYLYRILRANFDGYASKACPDPPAPRRGDGEARYLTGRRVTGLRYAEGLVTLQVVNQAGSEESLTSELVVGADGFNSSVRRLVEAPQMLSPRYAGYFAWRGSVPRKMVSRETADYFLNNASFNLMGNKTYILCYVIPTDHGLFDPDELLLNWLVYQDLAEGSPEEAAIFTDRRDGRRCHTTVAPGALDPDVWARHRAALLPRMIAPFAEVVARSPVPFATKVREHAVAAPRGPGRTTSTTTASSSDYCCDRYDGRVVLVGDALATYRPNLGRATDQAAAHCLSLMHVWRGERTLAAWEGDACREAARVLLLSRIMSEFGKGTWFSLFRSVTSYLWYNLRSKLWRARL